VISRGNLVDLMWQSTTLDEALHEARRLVDDLRRRPAALPDTDVAFANLIGILSEMNLVDEASKAATEALPIMRRSGNYYLEEWIHLFWRRGQYDTAAVLLGAFEAVPEGIESLQTNERRLLAQARADLEASMPAEAMAKHVAAGAALRAEELSQLLAEALAPRPAGPQ